MTKHLVRLARQQAIFGVGHSSNASGNSGCVTVVMPQAMVGGYYLPAKKGKSSSLSSYSCVCLMWVGLSMAAHFGTFKNIAKLVVNKKMEKRLLKLMLYNLVVVDTALAVYEPSTILTLHSINIWSRSSLMKL